MWVNFSGITIGTHARKIISKYEANIEEITNDDLHLAVGKARNLIQMNINVLN